MPTRAKTQREGFYFRANEVVGTMAGGQSDISNSSQRETSTPQFL